MIFDAFFDKIQNMELKKDERLDDLQLNNLFIIQNPNEYCFTSDAVILANHVKVRKGERVCDLGTGSGIIPILLSAKTELSEVVGLELQEYQVDMATRSVEYNGLTERVKIVHGDIKEGKKIFGTGTFDVVVSNPPYGISGSGDMKKGEGIARSRYEITVTLEEVIKTASELVKFGGKVYIINKAERLGEMIYLMTSYKLEPKSVINVFRKGNIADTVIVEGVLGGKKGLKVYGIKE